MSTHDPESTEPPPGHGENVPPRGQHRCPECGALVQNVRPAADDGWLGWCPDHGTVRLP